MDGAVDMVDDCWKLIVTMLEDSLSINLFALTCNQMQRVVLSLNIYHPINLEYQIAMSLAVHHGYPGILVWLSGLRRPDGPTINRLVKSAYTALSDQALTWLEANSDLLAQAQYHTEFRQEFSKSFTMRIIPRAD